MKFFYLINDNQDFNLDIEIRKNNNNFFNIFNKDDLTKTKTEIDNYENKKWNQSKKNIHKYEYIYTSSNNSKNISNINPISRSFFKLYEILKDVEIKLENNSIVCCICEGPGGFIQCINDNYEINNIYGITLINKDNVNIPYWHNRIINNLRNNIFISSDGKSDIYNYDTIHEFINYILKNNKDKIDLVTSDGGFDYSDNYNNQEISSYQLLFCEIYINLNIQRIGGNFIIKFFDLFNYSTIQLIYLLSKCYSDIIIFKPSFSRISNSEKYIIFRNFHGISKENLEILKNNFHNYKEIFLDVPLDFIKKINKYNNIYVLNQCREIDNIIKNIKDNNITYNPSKEQINNAIKWCYKYNIPINYKCIYLKNNEDLLNDNK